MIAFVDCVRIDKWLWAARFFKTRTLAADAVKGGRVELGGARVKAAKEVTIGDELQITIGQTRRTVIVRGVSDKRGPAKVAQTLYEETRGERCRARGGRRAAAAHVTAAGRRPRDAADQARPAPAGLGARGSALAAPAVG